MHSFLPLSFENKEERKGEAREKQGRSKGKGREKQGKRKGKERGRGGRKRGSVKDLNVFGFLMTHTFWNLKRLNH